MLDALRLSIIRGAIDCGKTPKLRGGTGLCWPSLMSGRLLRGTVMNDRQLEIAAYAAFAFVCATAIIAALAIADQLIHIA
jgi:hypothetical protein